MNMAVFVVAAVFLVVLSAVTAGLVVYTVVYFWRYPTANDPGEYADDKW